MKKKIISPLMLVSFVALLATSWSLNAATKETKNELVDITRRITWISGKAPNAPKNDTIYGKKKILGKVTYYKQLIEIETKIKEFLDRKDELQLTSDHVSDLKEDLELAELLSKSLEKYVLSKAKEE